jgi:hypothetical protein
LLTFFKTNDPYRLAGVFILLLIIRIPILSLGVPMILPELKWLLIGERLGSGDYTMYQDVWAHTAPLAVFVYKWLYVLFGKSRIVYQIFSILLVIIQVGIFNNIMLKNKAYNHNTYVPALIYMLFMNSFFDFLTLSPVLMSMTFVLLAINNLFKRMDNKTKDELFIYTGVHLGIACLFYLPTFFFLIVTTISLIVFTGSIFRRMLLLIYGFILVLVLQGLLFYWNDGFLIFQHHFFMSLWKISANDYLSGRDLLFLSITPLVILVISVVKMNQLGRYINFQVKMQRVMMLFLLFGLLSMLIMKESTSYQLIFFVPCVAFFVSHYLLVIRNWISAELNFLLVAVLIILNHLFTANKWLYVDQFVNYDNLIVTESKYDDLVSKKKILVLGPEMNHYKNAQNATPYLDWRLAKIQLLNLNYYDNSAEVLSNLTKDLPEIIIDSKGITPNIFAMMPTIKRNYVQHPDFEEIYLLKNKEDN